MPEILGTTAFSAARMRPLHECPPQLLTPIKALFFDIDDTFSTRRQQSGRITNRIESEAYHALWELFLAGVHVIPVTGRPAGWCDLIARMWPVTGVVGENGAFYATMTPGPRATLSKRYVQSEKRRFEDAKRLKGLRSKILRRFKGVRFASDQAYREFDLAVDVCEDVRPWPQSRVDELLRFAREAGAQAKLSSIHVNIWFGKYDKLSCVRKFMQEKLNLDPKHDLHQVAYIGDSPNDEPFFESFPMSFGVANVEDFKSKLQHAPAWVTPGHGGQGFAQLAAALLKRK
jgi:HAD superfamily hydrolase (TIGR01484 family)